MKDQDLIISTLCKLNQNILKEVSELRKEQEKSKVSLHHMITYFLQDSTIINDLMKEHQNQDNSWSTCLNEMEEKFTVLNEKFLAKLKEKEDIIVALQEYLEQCIASNATSSP